jgi:outer membrane biogenesis lipoprotein LolB
MKKVKIISFLLLIFALSFLFAGCATTNDAKTGKGVKSSWTYQASIEEVWNATNDALESIKQSCTSGRRFEITEQNKEDRYFLAESRLGVECHDIVNGKMCQHIVNKVL